jgi:hypothetical protein
MLPCDGVTIDRVWIDNQIYWTPEHTAHDYILQITITPRLVFLVTVYTAHLVAASNGEHSFSFGFPNCPWPQLLQLPTDCLQTISRPTHNGSWSSLYSLGMNLTENTASNSISTIAHVSIAAITWWLLSHCLATGMFTELFPNNWFLLVSQFWLLADMPQYIKYAIEIHLLHVHHSFNKDVIWY